MPAAPPCLQRWHTCSVLRCRPGQLYIIELRSTRSCAGAQRLQGDVPPKYTLHVWRVPTACPSRVPLTEVLPKHRGSNTQHEYAAYLSSENCMPALVEMDCGTTNCQKKHAADPVAAVMSGAWAGGHWPQHAQQTRVGPPAEVRLASVSCDKCLPGLVPSWLWRALTSRGGTCSKCACCNHAT